MTRKRTIWEKTALAAGLIALSTALYFSLYLAYGDFVYIQKYVLYHVAFLPIHALILGIILEEILTYREKKAHHKKLNMFLGIFFRQMGVEFYTKLVELVENRDQLVDIITVHPHWRRHDFRAARRALAAFNLQTRTESGPLLKEVFFVLRAREDEILKMTRNPNLWEFENLYRCVVALFHLLEENRFRGEVEGMPAAALKHLAEDGGKALVLLLGLWLEYLEFLKGQHPILFEFQVGVHSTVQPILLDSSWDN